MKDRQTLLAEIEEGLHTGILTDADLKSFVVMPTQPSQGAVEVANNDKKADKLSAVDVMFYIAGIVFFSTIMSSIAQSWDDSSAFLHITLSAGIGALLWLIVYSLLRNSIQTDIRKGLTNALLLTGSLLLIVGGFITTNEAIGGFNEVNFIPGAVTLLVLSVLHIAYDRLIKKDLTLLTGILLGVAAFPAFMFGLLQDADTPTDVWSLILILSVALLAYATRVVAKINPSRLKTHSAFDSFAAFIALMSMYVSSFGEYGELWLCVLIASVFGIFYLSIISQNKHLLGNASFFLVLTVVTIAFKYFSGFGITASLVVATVGLLGSAAVASSINKKYFKQPASVK